MKMQLKLMESGFDWDKEIRTSDPEYFKWTQYYGCLIQMWQAGLVQRKRGLVNWDPIDETVLANEQVIKGRAERSGGLVVLKELEQYCFMTTKYAKRLEDDLHLLKEMQRNWIGGVNGRLIDVTLGLSGTAPFHTKAWIKEEDAAKPQTIQLLIHPHHPFFTQYSNPTIEGPTNIVATISNISYKVEISLAVSDPTHLAFSDQPGLTASSDTHTLPKGIFKRTYNLKDWVVSRQRRWGTPIPMLRCKTCGPQPVAISSLPVLEDSSAMECPICKGETERESETMDTFVDSSWYFLRFLDPFNTDAMVAAGKGRQVDVYVGGIEHAVMHLLFVTKVMGDLGLVDGIFNGEPFKKLLCQGMVLGETYKVDGRFAGSNRRYLTKKEGLAMNIIPTFEKMSKSKFNGVDPEELIRKWGADTVRMYILSKCHPEVDLKWRDEGINGMDRVLVKLEKLVDDCWISRSGKVEPRDDHALRVSLNQAIEKVNDSINSYAFHNTISHLIVLLSVIKKSRACQDERRNAAKCLVTMMTPFSTKRCQDMWRWEEQMKWPTILT